MNAKEMLRLLLTAKRALEDYHTHTAGVMIPTTRWQGQDALEQIMDAITQLRKQS